MPKSKKPVSRKSPATKAKVVVKIRPIKGTSARKAGKKRSHDFALKMREKISENWVELKKKFS